jgi:hypothetical protein
MFYTTDHTTPTPSQAQRLADPGFVEMAALANIASDRPQTADPGACAHVARALNQCPVAWVRNAVTVSMLSGTA